MQLDLVEYGETAERAPDFLQMFDLEIRYANPAEESFLTPPQKFFVCAETLFPIRSRPVEKLSLIHILNVCIRKKRSTTPGVAILSKAMRKQARRP